MTPQEFFNTVRRYGDPDIPDGANSDAIIKGYLRMLSDYDEETLDKAWNLIEDNRNHRNFPLIPELKDYCREAQNEIAAKRVVPKDTARGDPWSDARIRAADRMMNSEIGRLAAQEEWIVHLHDFCRECQRLPNHLESERVRREGLGIKAERERLANSASTAAGLKIIASVARTMDAKRKRLVALAFGRDAG